MASQRDLLVNFERMRREMDELFDDAWGGRRTSPQRQSGFAPRVDVYYREADGGPVAVVKADLAGVDIAEVTLEVSGRELVIGGRRELGRVSGRIYQQVEIPTGPFRRVVELRADVDSEHATASYDDGILRVELPLRSKRANTTQVPIERSE